jgi:hypothetical protein
VSRNHSLITNGRSCTVLYSLVSFTTGKIGVLQGDWQGFNSPCSRNFLMVVVSL